ncbi:hypothetical protein ACFQJC_08150 [Haloferax namakaokahaiae]|uniref:YHS domain-containing protein n=1 Tax=Haloferax namakaokahaiae TaxID=1748331 RepID=A0ABD5ZE49_9EURY
MSCNSRIDTTEWYPVVTELSGESVILYPFCDDECLDKWQAENPQSKRVENEEPS